MGILIIISFFCAALSIGILWLILYFPIKWLASEKNVNKIRWGFSILLGSILTYYLLFTSPEYNHEYALLIPKGDKYELTLTGERLYMSHDPISALSRETFTDTMILKLPRKKGLIKGSEIIKENGYPLLGSVEVSDGLVTVELYYDNYDDHIKDPLSYNGSYKLKK